MPPLKPEPPTRARRRALAERFEGELARALVGRGLVSRMAIEEALNLQVVVGGDLSTNLWDLSLLPSEQATTVGAEIQRLKPAPFARMGNLPARIVGLIPREVAATVRILPFAIVDRTLHVASSEPWNIAAVEQVAFATGLGIECYYLAEVPLSRLLAWYYRTTLPSRIQLGPQVPPAARLAGSADARPAALARELTDEAGFRALYGERAAFIPGAAATESLPPESDLPEIELRLEDAVLPEDLSISEPVSSVHEALTLLDAALDRDAVGMALARFALSRGKRVALFVHTGELWSGWTGAGGSVSPAAVHALALQDAAGSVFGLVGSSGAPYLGPLVPHPVHERLLQALGGGWPRSVGLFPVHYRGKLSFGIYLDSGEGAYASPDLADILLVAQRVPTVLTRVVRRRLFGSGQAAP